MCVSCINIILPYYIRDLSIGLVLYPPKVLELILHRYGRMTVLTIIIRGYGFNFFSGELKSGLGWYQS
jgi:hypothetical protein